MGNHQTYAYNYIEPHVLFDACRNGNITDVYQSLNPSELINSHDNFNRTPLHIACQNGHINIVNILLNHGATIDVFDIYNNTPLHLACDRGHINIVSLLLENGASIHSKLLLHTACAGGHADVVKILLKYNVSIDELDFEGNTPLHYASLHGCYYATITLIPRTIYSEPNINYIDIINLLLDYGSDPTILNKYKQKPSQQLSVENGCDEIKSILKKAELSRWWRSSEAQTMVALRSMIKDDRTEIINNSEQGDEFVKIIIQTRPWLFRETIWWL